MLKKYLVAVSTKKHGCTGITHVLIIKYISHVAVLAGAVCQRQNGMGDHLHGANLYMTLLVTCAISELTRKFSKADKPAR